MLPSLLRYLPRLALLLSLSAVAVAADTWQAGLGRAKITPTEPLWMTGYALRTKPGSVAAQDLWVKALAVKDSSGNRGVLVTADLCGVTRQLTDIVTAELMRRFSLPRSAIMINASHTHSGPVVDGYLAGLRIISGEDQKRLVAYHAFIEKQMVEAASQALNSLAPATLGIGYGEATFGINRRNNPAGELAKRTAAGTLVGPTDPRVPIMVVKDAKGTLLGILVSYACHNTTLSGYEFHGDFAGSMQLEIERRHPSITALFVTGCAADINPFPRGEVAHADAHGKALADTTDHVLAGPLSPIVGKFGSAFDDITLHFSRIPTEEELRTNREKEQPNKEMYQAWSQIVSEDLEKRGPAAVLQHKYPIQAWRVGALSWIALGGEVVVDYGLRLRRELGDSTWVFGYTNDVMAYIPNERVLKEGRYEGDTSMVPYGKPGKWAPGLEEKIVTRAKELVKAAGAEK